MNRHISVIAAAVTIDEGFEARNFMEFYYIARNPRAGDFSGPCTEWGRGEYGVGSPRPHARQGRYRAPERSSAPDACSFTNKCLTAQIMERFAENLEEAKFTTAYKVLLLFSKGTVE